MKTEIDQAVQTLAKSDLKSLYARLGAANEAFADNPAQFAAPNFALTVATPTAGALLDDAIDLGKRILRRWNKVLYDLVCGSDDADEQARKTILDALNIGTSDAFAAAITAVLISTFSVGPAIAAVVGVLFGKVLMPAAGEEICSFWKERV